MLTAKAQIRLCMPRSDSTDALSDQGLHYSLTESLDITECMNGEQRPGSYFAHEQDDLNLCILHMFEGTCSFMWPIFESFRFLHQIVTTKK